MSVFLSVSEFMSYQDLSSCVCVLSESEFMCASLTGSGEIKLKENLCYKEKKRDGEEKK